LHQLEVVSLVLALKIVFPDKVWLLLGNHEDAVQNQAGGDLGFPAECNRRLGHMGPRVFKTVNVTWNWFPFGCIIEKKVLVVHGGIGDGDWNVNYLTNVRRPIDHDGLPADPILYNVLWSDPLPDDGDPAKTMGVHDSPRDNHLNTVATYGPDITKDFCERNCLSAIVRSHQVFQQGMGFDVLHYGRCVRVFSARDYCGVYTNDGSILSVTKMSNEVHGEHVLVRAQVCKSLNSTRTSPPPMFR
jgi:hypothetical protein